MINWSVVWSINSENDEKCQSVFPKAKEDVLKYPQPEDILFFHYREVKEQEIIQFFCLENS